MKFRLCCKTTSKHLSLTNYEIISCRITMEIGVCCSLVVPHFILPTENVRHVVITILCYPCNSVISKAIAVFSSLLLQWMQGFPWADLILLRHEGRGDGRDDRPVSYSGISHSLRRFLHPHSSLPTTTQLV